MRVLVVEDYTLIREPLVQALREHGFAVDAAANGRDGGELIAVNDYDVIVLDWMLPEVSGLALLKDLRRRNCQSAVLLLTARDEITDRVTGLEAGADDYLVKPFAVAELLARVKSLVRRRYQSPDPVIRVGELEVDTTARRVQVDGAEVSLTAREFALLEYLASRKGAIVSRQEIEEHVYDFRSEATSNVVDVYIGYVRRKIERDGQPRLIHTHRGQGYSLRVEP